MDKQMLETSQERVELLKKGIDIKKIEELYLKSNNFEIVETPVVLKIVELNSEENAETATGQEALA